MFLHNYRNMPSTDAKIIPAHKMFSYKPRTALSKIKLSEEFKTSQEQRDGVKNLNLVKKNVSKPPEIFEVNEKVLYISRTTAGCFSHAATVVKKVSNVTYQIRIKKVIKLAHVNQLRKSKVEKFLFGSNKEIKVQENTRNKKRIEETDSLNGNDIGVKDEVLSSDEGNSDDELSLEQKEELRRSSRAKKNIFESFKGFF